MNFLLRLILLSNFCEFEEGSWLFNQPTCLFKVCIIHVGLKYCQQPFLELKIKSNNVQFGMKVFYVGFMKNFLPYQFRTQDPSTGPSDLFQLRQAFSRNSAANCYPGFAVDLREITSRVRLLSRAVGGDMNNLHNFRAAYLVVLKYSCVGSVAFSMSGRCETFFQKLKCFGWKLKALKAESASFPWKHLSRVWSISVYFVSTNF